MFKPGDLVMVVKPTRCCGYAGGLGRIFVVTDKGWRAPKTKCVHCSHTRDSKNDVELSSITFIEPHRLRLIPPLSELETTEREVEHAA